DLPVLAFAPLLNCLHHDEPDADTDQRDDREAEQRREQGGPRAEVEITHDAGVYRTIEMTQSIEGTTRENPGDGQRRPSGRRIDANAGSFGARGGWAGYQRIAIHAARGLDCGARVR